MPLRASPPPPPRPAPTPAPPLAKAPLGTRTCSSYMTSSHHTAPRCAAAPRQARRVGPRGRGLGVSAANPCVCRAGTLIASSHCFTPPHPPHSPQLPHPKKYHHPPAPPDNPTQPPRLPAVRSVLQQPRHTVGQRAPCAPLRPGRVCGGARRAAPRGDGGAHPVRALLWQTQPGAVQARWGGGVGWGKGGEQEGGREGSERGGAEGEGEGGGRVGTPSGGEPHRLPWPGCACRPLQAAATRGACSPLPSSPTLPSHRPSPKQAGRGSAAAASRAAGPAAFAPRAAAPGRHPAARAARRRRVRLQRRVCCGRQPRR